ncbi:Uncharacterized protein dnm_079320 [Desulfonema magnum]|uniref:Uncharacterized protein n=1 Tax=Desulfonema magnum TaxID=45655 RepID=A0A975GT83_9BACT|nr:Uncharacterized protein dnm_079320 [Desulfonema magnum]
MQTIKDRRGVKNLGSLTSDASVRTYLIRNCCATKQTLKKGGSDVKPFLKLFFGQFEKQTRTDSDFPNCIYLSYSMWLFATTILFNNDLKYLTNYIHTISLNRKHVQKIFDLLTIIKKNDRLKKKRVRLCKMKK